MILSKFCTPCMEDPLFSGVQSKTRVFCSAASFSLWCHSTEEPACCLKAMSNMYLLLSASVKISARLRSKHL